jgi:hypothetical protein
VLNLVMARTGTLVVIVALVVELMVWLDRLVLSLVVWSVFSGSLSGPGSVGFFRSWLVMETSAWSWMVSLRSDTRNIMSRLWLVVKQDKCFFCYSPRPRRWRLVNRLGLISSPLPSPPVLRMLTSIISLLLVLCSQRANG